MNHFFKLFYITAKNIRCSKTRNLITILFVAFAVFFMNISLASFRYSHCLNEFARTSGLYDSYMYVGLPQKQVYRDYMESSGTDLSAEAYAYLADELEQLKVKCVIMDYGKSGQYSGQIAENTTHQATFLFMKPDLLKELSMPVAKGKWFDDDSADYQKEGLIPVVIGNHLKSIYTTGDTFTGDSSGTNYIVIGILKRGTRFLNPMIGGSGTDLNSANQIADELVIVGEEYPEVSRSFVIRLPDRDKAASEHAVLEKTADISDTFSFRYLTDKAHENNVYQIQMQTTLAVLSLFICIVGTACGNLLSFVRGKRRQAVYFLCGMEPKTSVICMALENLVKLYLPALIGLYVFFLIFQKYCSKTNNFLP